MLVVLAHNTGKGSQHEASYDVEVRINHTPIWKGHVDGHDREDGWPALLRMIADAAEGVAEVEGVA